LCERNEPTNASPLRFRLQSIGQFVEQILLLLNIGVINLLLLLMMSIVDVLLVEHEHGDGMDGWLMGASMDKCRISEPEKTETLARRANREGGVHLTSIIQFKMCLLKLVR
jgi:hypothetical protein